MNIESVHIVMVTHSNRANVLKQTIPAILKTKYPFTLTVVANKPAKISQQYLYAAEPLLYKLIINKDNLGYPIAANQGWRVRPEADYTCHLGDDCLPLESDWLRKLVDIARCCPEVGIVGHAVEPASFPLRTFGEGVCKRTVQVQPCCLGGITLIPRRVFEQVGYYNEEMGPYGETDAMLGWKVHRLGLVSAYFDHGVLGRSFKHLDGGDTRPNYRQWKGKQRQIAIQKREELKREYEAGRPLNQ